MRTSRRIISTHNCDRFSSLVRRRNASARFDNWADADFVGNFSEFVAAKFFQMLASSFEVLVHLDGFLGHFSMCLFAAAVELEIFALRDADMAVFVVEAEAKQQRFLFPFSVHFHRIADFVFLSSRISLILIVLSTALHIS